ncbi:MAG: 5-formyltetrahydrofolate cyclo-ligase [Janthinobacterium lividum]
MTDKTVQRQALLAARSALPPLQRMENDAALSRHLLAWLAHHPVACIGVYLPIRNEPDLGAAYRTLVENGVLLCLPVVRQRDVALEFLPWFPGEQLGRDASGIGMPLAPRDAIKPPLLLLPCVGYNARGFRLGYGAGYYDRTLALPERPATIGIAYCQALCDFDTAPHDIALDMVLTEAGPCTAAR